MSQHAIQPTSTHLAVSIEQPYDAGMRDHPSLPADDVGNVFNPACPARSVLDILAEKWPLLLIHALADGPARPGALRRRIGGISDKMLVQTLRRLERSGFVARRSFAEVPPRVEYSLTPLGASLSEPIKALDHWVERNLAEIDLAQRGFDQSRTPDASAQR